MYKGKISLWIFKVVFLEMRILRIRQYVMCPTKCLIDAKASVDIQDEANNHFLYLILIKYSKIQISSNDVNTTNV